MYNNINKNKQSNVINNNFEQNSYLVQCDVRISLPISWQAQKGDDAPLHEVS